MTFLRIKIPGIPQPKQSARFRAIKAGDGRTFMSSYQSKAVKDNERNIRYEIRSQLPEGFVPFTRGVVIHKLHYIFPPLKTFSKSTLRDIEEGRICPKTTKPDLTDNLSKGLIDAMQGIIFLNDSQICEMHDVKKYYGKVPGILIELEEI